MAQKQIAIRFVANPPAGRDIAAMEPDYEHHHILPSDDWSDLELYADGFSSGLLDRFAPDIPLGATVQHIAHTDGRDITLLLFFGESDVVDDEDIADHVHRDSLFRIEGEATDDNVAFFTDGYINALRCDWRPPIAEDGKWDVSLSTLLLMKNEDHDWDKDLASIEACGNNTEQQGD